MAHANLPQESSGRHSSHEARERLIQAHACCYPPAVETCDLLLVDFNCHTVRYASLYLVEEIKDGQVVWMGCRNFDVTTSGVKVDETGEGDWKPFAGYAASHWRIAGEVKEVFKPASRLIQTRESRHLRNRNVSAEVCHA